MKNNNSLSIVTNGIIRENPTLVLILGTCPTLATTTNVFGAFGMGIATLMVLICSNMLISLLRRVIPDNVRIPCYIVIIAGFVTVVQMVIHAFLPALYDMLGVYLALIVVNCIILGRAEMFASKNSVGRSALDGLGMGIGFTLALCAMAIIREVLGAGSFAGIAIPFMQNFKIEFLVRAPGGMVVYGLLIALVGALTHGQAPKKKSFSCAGCPSAKICGHNNGCDVHNGSCSGTAAGEITKKEEA